MTALPSPLLVVTDRLACGNLSLVATIDSVMAVGGRWVWFRERDMDGGDRLGLAVAVMEPVRAIGGTFSLGGDAAMAAAIDADGVHLPGGAAPDEIRRARDLLPDGLIGISAHSLREVEAAARAGADYCTLSPIFATASKPGYGPALGTEAIRSASASGMSIVALGGISPDTVGDCRDAGAAGIAIMGGLMRTADPGAAALDLLQALNQRPEGP